MGIGGGLAGGASAFEFGFSFLYIVLVVLVGFLCIPRLLSFGWTVLGHSIHCPHTMEERSPCFLVLSDVCQLRWEQWHKKYQQQYQQYQQQSPYQFFAEKEKTKNSTTEPKCTYSRSLCEDPHSFQTIFFLVLVVVVVVFPCKTTYHTVSTGNVA